MRKSKWWGSDMFSRFSGLIRVTNRQTSENADHVHCKCGNISETLHDTTNRK